MRKIYGNIEINTDYEYYKYLGVDENATTEEIMKGFENSKAELASASINMTGEEVATSYLLLEQAVKILTDDELRKAYDDLVRETNNHVNKEEVEQLVIDAEKQLEYNKKDELIVQLEEEREKLRKINEANEEYIKELERKLSTSKVEQTIEDYRDDDDIKEDDDDIKKTLLDTLNQDGDRDIEIIDIKNNKKNNDASKEVKEEPKVEEKPIPVIKVENNNDNDKNNGNDNDIKPIFKDTEEEPQKVEEVEEVDKKERFAVKLSSLGSKAFITVAGISALAIAILTYSSNSSKRAESILEENGIDKNSIATNMVNSIDDDTEVEEEITEQVSTIEEEPYEVELDVNSDAVILETVEKINTEVAKISDPVAKDMLNSETIEALVRYTRDNSVISGETAYELFAIAYKNGIDTSMFFENLESYETMNKLYASTKAIDANNNTYDDEIVAYLSIDNAVDSLKADDYAAIWNVSAISDEATGISSMVMISDKEVKLEAPEKLRDVNNDGKITNEENVEGEEYWDEKNSISSDNKVKCGAIYDKVRSDQESKLRNLRWNALDNENVRTLG